ncbi:MAG: hypothetical protein J2P37_24765 [Ktedonobacteraceae bacterium]|nr:hypothetical protein [Ktedonobacteraceae bacterium]
MKNLLTSRLAQVPKWVIMGAMLCMIVAAVLGVGTFYATRSTHAAPTGSQQVYVWATSVIVRSDHVVSPTTDTHHRVSRQQVTAICELDHTGNWATGSDSHNTYHSDNWVYIDAGNGVTGWISTIWVKTPTDVIPGLRSCHNPKAV